MDVVRTLGDHGLGIPHGDEVEVLDPPGYGVHVEDRWEFVLVPGNLMSTKPS